MTIKTLIVKHHVATKSHFNGIKVRILKISDINHIKDKIRKTIPKKAPQG